MFVLTNSDLDILIRIFRLKPTPDPKQDQIFTPEFLPDPIRSKTGSDQKVHPTRNLTVLSLPLIATAHPSFQIATAASSPAVRSAMEMPSISSTPRTVDDIFKDYNGRRTGIVRALTIDVDEFYALCDPEKENLCLYGHPDGSWEVTLPAEEVPPELPEPALGINFARDGMNRKDWLSLVAVHSDSWLLSVAFYMGARFNGNDRKRLFSMINDLPTVFEVVAERKQAKDKTSADSGSKFRLSTKRSNDGQIKSNSKPVDEGYFEDEDEHSETLCGTCGGNYSANEFWIGCDICERWFHGKCVKITPAKAESIKQYKCPSCSSKKVRP